LSSYEAIPPLPARGTNPGVLIPNFAEHDKNPTSCGRVFHGGGEGVIDFFIELAVDAHPSMTTLVVEIDAVLVRYCLSFEAIPSLPARGTNPRGSHPVTSPPMQKADLTRSA